jgi:ferredoxin
MAGVPEVDLSKCTKCDACVEVCPEVFRFNEAGFIEILELAEYPEDCVREAIKYCPAECISWKDSE